MHPKKQHFHERTMPMVHIDDAGKTNPNSITISVTAEDGVDFDAAYPCCLHFSPKCPFEHAWGNTVALSKGPNPLKLAPGAEKRKYRYMIVPPGNPQRTECAAVWDDPADIIIVP